MLFLDIKQKKRFKKYAKIDSVNISGILYI